MKEKPIDPKKINYGCLNCTPVTHQLEMDRVLAVGFGTTTVSRDGEIIYDEHDAEIFPQAIVFEKMAAEDPYHDWRISFFAPLHEEVYQRHGAEKWMMISSGPGFA